MTSFKKMTIGLTAVFTLFTITAPAAYVHASNDSNNKSIILKVNDPWMYVNSGTDQNIKMLDSEEGATPVIRNGRTLLPIANIVNEFGGTVKWDSSDKKVSIVLNGNTINLWIDRKKAVVNQTEKTLDVSPTIINNRTMVPLRFVSDNLKIKLIWDGDNQIIALYNGGYANVPTSYGEYFNHESDTPNNGNEESETKENTDTVASDKPIDKNGVLIAVGDRVTYSFFYGKVEKIDRGRVLVSWDSKNNLWLKDEDADFMAVLAGIKYKSKSWIDAASITADK